MINYDAFVDSEAHRAAEQLALAAAIFQMVRIEAGLDFHQLCRHAGVPPALAEDLVAWIVATDPVS